MENSREKMGRMLMLLWYNKELLDKGLISPLEYRRMSRLIRSKYEVKEGESRGKA